MVPEPLPELVNNVIPGIRGMAKYLPNGHVNYGTTERLRSHSVASRDSARCMKTAVFGVNAGTELHTPVETNVLRVAETPGHSCSHALSLMGPWGSMSEQRQAGGRFSLYAQTKLKRPRFGP